LVARVTDGSTAASLRAALVPGAACALLGVAWSRRPAPSLGVVLGFVATAALAGIGAGGLLGAWASHDDVGALVGAAGGLALALFWSLPAFVAPARAPSRRAAFRAGSIGARSALRGVGFVTAVVILAGAAFLGLAVGHRYGGGTRDWLGVAIAAASALALV